MCKNKDDTTTGFADITKDLGEEGEKTFCHKCGDLLIDRFGFSIRKNRMQNSHCPQCSAEIPGVWE